MNNWHPFWKEVREDFTALLAKGAASLPAEECLRVDLHCHDHHSDVPDELWGRILRLPETWLKTEDLVRRLQRTKTDLITITNHNNARSCWELSDKGFDVLPGAEFTVAFSELELSAHVLTYGFTPEQETRLNRLRFDAPRFLDYCRAHDLPTVLPHPLFLYHKQKALPFETFEKLSLMFERFEGVNGQRDVWQNLLVATWLEGLDEERLEGLAKKHGMDAGRWCASPYLKRMTGGSDDHFGLFAGATGTLLHVPGLAHRLKTSSRAELALEALRHGKMAPYGEAAHDEKLSLAFMDYFCSVALHIEDPGLLRMMLHRGSIQDKMACFAISNAMQELRRHKYTTKFLKCFSEALQGRKPGLLTTLSVNKNYRPLLDEVAAIAEARSHADREGECMTYVDNMFFKMNQLITKRITQKVGASLRKPDAPKLGADEIIRRLEVPSHLRALAQPAPGNKRKDMTELNVSDLMDQLSFPALASGLLAGARFAGARVIHNDRHTVENFANALGRYQAPRRLLWLTDTLNDQNGVSSVLLAALEEVRRRDLPIDFLVCREDMQSSDHLIVVPPVGDFALEQFSSQRLRVPNLLDIQKVFSRGAYDRVMASTEFSMGAVALYLQQAFKVPAFMYMHTDWMDYVRRVTRLDPHNLDRVRRVLRALYKRFDGVFVLNSEHRDWLCGPAMGLRRQRVHQTAHWTAPCFAPPTMEIDRDKEAPVLLYAGRLSEEKGVYELPAIMERVKQDFPRALLRIAGAGVAEERLRALLPTAEFLGWVEASRLPEIYSQADMLLLPSRFDTFGCVVTEAMACGTPVGAFDCKGPRDIIGHGMDGLLAPDAQSLGEAVGKLLREGGLAPMREAALRKAASYSAQSIMDKLLLDTGLQSDASA